ncbi:DUF7373 family lipoprotein [Rhodococcus triatomae]
MNTRTMTTTAAAVVAGSLLLTACGGGDEPTAGSGGDSPASTTAAAVDPATLDTGDFPTSPQKEFPQATEKNITMVEGQRLAEYTVLPLEIDPELTESSAGYSPILSGGADGLTFFLDNFTTDLPPEADTYLYGYRAGAQKPGSTAEPQKELSVTPIRLPDHQSAVAFAQALHAYSINPEVPTAGTEGRIDVMPNSLASRYTDGESTSLTTWTVHGDWVIHTWASAPAAQESWTAQTAARALQEQEPLLDKFPASNMSDPGSWPIIDQDKVLIYTLPFKSGGGGTQMGIYGPRGMSMTSTNPPLTFDVLTEAGADHNAVAGSIVYRAADADGAAQIQERFLADLSSHNGYTDVTVPAGLENTATQCQTNPLEGGTYCMTQVGRYTAEASAMDATEASQRISAQYLILQQADQEA